MRSCDWISSAHVDCNVGSGPVQFILHWACKSPMSSCCWQHRQSMAMGWTPLPAELLQRYAAPPCALCPLVKATPDEASPCHRPLLTRASRCMAMVSKAFSRSALTALPACACNLHRVAAGSVGHAYFSAEERPQVGSMGGLGQSVCMQCISPCRANGAARAHIWSTHGAHPCIVTADRAFALPMGSLHDCHKYGCTCNQPS